VEDIGYKKEEVLYIPLSYDTKRYLKYADFSKRDTKKILFSAGIIRQAGSFVMVDLALSMPEYQFIFALRQFNQKSESELAVLQ